MQMSESGRRILAERPLLTTDLSALLALPAGSFGHALGEWYRSVLLEEYCVAF